jgi:hypothetical protein
MQSKRDNIFNHLTNNKQTFRTQLRRLASLQNAIKIIQHSLNLFEHANRDKFHIKYEFSILNLGAEKREDL